MEETGDQLDFNDELNNLDLKKVTCWRRFYAQIVDLQPPDDGFSSHITFANITAWFYYHYERIGMDLKYAIKEGEYTSSDCTKLKLAIETKCVTEWIDQHSDGEFQFGELEPLKSLIKRLAFTEYSLRFILDFWENEDSILADIRENNEYLFDLQIDSQIKLYYPSEEQLIAERRAKMRARAASNQEYLRKIKLRELDNKAKELEYERQKKWGFGTGMFFGIAIGACLMSFAILMAGY